MLKRLVETKEGTKLTKSLKGRGKQGSELLNVCYESAAALPTRPHCGLRRRLQIIYANKKKRRYVFSSFQTLAPSFLPHPPSSTEETADEPLNTTEVGLHLQRVGSRLGKFFQVRSSWRFEFPLFPFSFLWGRGVEGGYIERKERRRKAVYFVDSVY